MKLLSNKTNLQQNWDTIKGVNQSPVRISCQYQWTTQRLNLKFPSFSSAQVPVSSHIAKANYNPIPRFLNLCVFWPKYLPPVTFWRNYCKQQPVFVGLCTKYLQLDCPSDWHWDYAGILLSRSNFKSETSFGFPSPNHTGKVLEFFIKPQNGLITLVSTKGVFQGIFRDKIGPLSSNRSFSELEVYY